MPTTPTIQAVIKHIGAHLCDHLQSSSVVLDGPGNLWHFFHPAIVWGVVFGDGWVGGGCRGRWSHCGRWSAEALEESGTGLGSLMRGVVPFTAGCAAWFSCFFGGSGFSGGSVQPLRIGNHNRTALRFVDRLTFYNIITSLHVITLQEIKTMQQAPQKQASEILGRYLEGVELSGDHEQELGDILRGHLDGTTVEIQVTSANRRSVDHLEGQLAKAILQMRAAGESDTLQIIMLHVPRVGKRAISELEDFISDYGGEFGWCVFDDKGTVRLLIEDLDVNVAEHGHDPRDTSRQTTHNKRAFTDLNRWLLKVLTLRDAPPGLWYDDDAFRRDITSPAELHRLADVSQAKAYQFARTFRDLGLLKWDRATFRVRQRQRLFERWYQDEQQLHVERIPVRPLLSKETSPRNIFSAGEDNALYALGGFEACRMYDVLHTEFRDPEVHVFENPKAICERFDLEVCADHEAALYLIRTPYKQSVRRGLRDVDGVKIVDILQAALDAARHPARGREQAEYIVEDVLGWS